MFMMYTHPQVGMKICMHVYIDLCVRFNVIVLSNC